MSTNAGHIARKRKIADDNTNNESENCDASGSGKVSKYCVSSNSSDNSASSSDLESETNREKCPICLKPLELQTVAIPDSCNHHTFCLTCLEEWSKTKKTCPVDRKEYRSILVLDPEGKVVRQLPILFTNPINTSQLIFCEICGLLSNSDGMLICDACGDGYHLCCLATPASLSSGVWLCDDCWFFNY